MSNPREVYIPVILAHAIPLTGVLAGSWDFITVVFSYWVETYLIGLALVYIFLLLLKVKGRKAGMAVPITHLLIGIAIITVIHLATLALLLIAVSGFLSPVGRASLVDLFHLFLAHISQFNFVLYAIAPICINTGLGLRRYISSKAYRQKTIAAKAVGDILWRILIHCLVLLVLAVQVSKGALDNLELVVGFFVAKAVVEIRIYIGRTSPGSVESQMFDGLIPSEVVSSAERTDKRRRVNRFRFKSKLSRWKGRKR